eukprot:5070932-Alexandrium_andersonii.AAC.1
MRAEHLLGGHAGKGDDLGAPPLRADAETAAKGDAGCATAALPSSRLTADTRTKARAPRCWRVEEEEEA